MGFVISMREFLSIVLTSISNVFFLSDSQQSSNAIPPHTQDNKVYTATSHVKGLLAMMVKLYMSRFANNALLGGGIRVRVWIREQRSKEDQRHY